MSKPEKSLANAPLFGEFPKDRTNRLLHSLVRMFLDASVSSAHVAHRDAQDQLPSPRFGEKPLVGALADPAELRFTDGPLESQQKSIVELAQIVDAFGINDQGVHQPAKVQELVPVPVIAGEARDLQAKHRAGLPKAYRSNQSLKTDPAGATGSRLTKIVIDDDHLAPAELPSLLSELVLATLALVVMPYLTKRGLTDVDECRSGEMLRTNLFSTGHRPPPRCARCVLRRLATARRADLGSLPNRDGTSSHCISSVHLRSN